MQQRAGCAKMEIPYLSRFPSLRLRAGREADDRALPRVPDAAAARDPQAGVRAEGAQRQGQVSISDACAQENENSIPLTRAGSAVHCMSITLSFGFCECFVTSVRQVPLGWWAELQLPSSPGK